VTPISPYSSMHYLIFKVIRPLKILVHSGRSYSSMEIDRFVRRMFNI